MDETTKGYLTDKHIWWRLVFMVLFFVVSWILRLVVALVAIFQFLTVLITGKRNETLLDFSERLAEYIYQIVSYVTFITDEKPFPFGQLPSSSYANDHTSDHTNR